MHFDLTTKQFNGMVKKFYKLLVTQRRFFKMSCRKNKK